MSRATKTSWVVEGRQVGPWLWSLNMREVEDPPWLDMGRPRPFYVWGSEARARRKAEAWVARQRRFDHRAVVRFTVRSEMEAAGATKETPQ